MKKALFVIPSLLALLITPNLNHQNYQEVKAAGAPTLGSLPTKLDIDLNDSTESEIRAYYSSLNSLSDSEKQGTNILKNLKPILQNFTYYSYDICWRIYEITDREWALSPANSTTYGHYNESTNIIEDYQFGSSSSNSKNNPYLHDLYKNRDENGITLEAGRLKAWEKHGDKKGGTDREHVWCQSRGFKDKDGASGPAGTDVHHLMAGDSVTNQLIHNNNPYGNVDTTKTYEDGTAYLSYIAGNKKGTPKKKSSQDQSDVVFEPQDCDKGDIARAIFYMAACYNNLSGTDTITQFNPNLTLADYATSAGASEDSSATHAVAMGILSDLLEWNKLDPVDEYEIHRNNLIYKNFQHNRNPFIDFPQWADYIWGGSVGQTINPANDKINDLGLSISISNKTIKPEESFSIVATTADNSQITWSIADDSIASLSKTTSESGEAITVTGLKEGTTTITVKATVDSEELTKTCSVVVSNETPKKSIPWLYIAIGAAVIVVLIILVIAIPSVRKKVTKSAKKSAQKAIKKQTKKSTKKKK